MPTSPVTRMLGVAMLVGGLGLVGCVSTAGTVSAVPATAVLLTTTTLVPNTTTSTVATTTTTTTLPPSTTSTAPTTTTTSSTTTTLPPSTTSTVPTTATTSTTPWGLIGLIVVLVALIGLVIVLMVSRNKKSALDAWRRRTRPALSDARLAREALLSPTAVSDDPELRGAVAAQVERASIALEQAGSGAPYPPAGGSAVTAAGSLRGLAFAIEADRLLRHGAGAPTGVQLAQADQARRDRDAELQGALARLQTHVTPTDGKG